MFKKIDSILKAKSIALVGASERARWPKTIYNNLKAAGYAGRVFPVNPRYDEIWGERCYRGIGLTPEPVEHALVIVPAANVVEVVEEGVEAGIKSATIYAANVGDGPHPVSHERGRRLLRIARDSGIVIGGPNCMGAASWREKLFLYPNVNMPKFEAGPVGVVFQSGGSLQFFIETCGGRGLKFSYAISSGNELVVDLADYVNFLVNDPETKVIALFIEGIRRVDAFKEAAARALAAKKPIVVIKTGRTQKSRDAAQSHTGAVGGDYTAFEALCERYGIVIAPSLDDMTETLLAFQQPRLPKGPRIGAVTTSGGAVDLLFDYAEDAGAVFPPYSAKTLKTIRPHIAEEVTLKNPLDCGIPRDIATQAMFCRTVLADPNIDMVVFANRPGRMTIEEAAPLKELADKTTKPLLAFERMRYAVNPESLAVQDHLGIPFMQGLPEALRGMNALWFYAQRAGRKIKLPAAPKGKAPSLKGEAFDRLLGRKGLTLPKSALVKTPEDAAKAAGRIGFPVVLKIVAPAFSHKTEVGGVLLGLKDKAAVADGARTLEGRIRKVDRKARITGYLVQEMVSGVEMIVGCRNDPVYGPVVLVGAGGIMVELIKDVAMRLLPVTADDVRAMLGELKSFKLLEGFRGSRKADVEALVAAVVGLSDIFLDHRHLLDDLEVNPLIVRPKGKGVAAVDVRPIRRAAAKK